MVTAWYEHKPVPLLECNFSEVLFFMNFLYKCALALFK